jgi:hypothetical protein
VEILKVLTDSHTVAHSMSKTTLLSRRNYTTPRDANLFGLLIHYRQGYFNWTMTKKIWLRSIPGILAGESPRGF